MNLKVGHIYDKDWIISRIYNHYSHIDLELINKNNGEYGYDRIEKKEH